MKDFLEIIPGLCLAVFLSSGCGKEPPEGPEGQVKKAAFDKPETTESREPAGKKAGKVVQAEGEQENSKSFKNEPVLWSWPKHEKRVKKILENFEKAHMDVDRVFFDTEEVPLEDPPSSPGKESK